MFDCFYFILQEQSAYTALRISLGAKFSSSKMIQRPFFIACTGTHYLLLIVDTQTMIVTAFSHIFN